MKRCCLLRSRKRRWSDLTSEIDWEGTEYRKLREYASFKIPHYFARLYDNTISSFDGLWMIISLTITSEILSLTRLFPELDLFPVHSSALSQEW